MILHRKLAVLFLAASLSGSLLAQGTAPVDDETIFAAVEAALHGAPSLAGADIEVTTRDGAVTLSGSAATMENIATAGRLAAHVRGVSAVYNKIRVANRPSRAWFSTDGMSAQAPATRKGLALALGAWLLCAGAFAEAQLLAPAPVPPDAMMSALAAEVMGTLREDRAAGRDTDLAQLVEKRIVPVFDFPRMTVIALARNSRLASSEQRLRLAAEFQTLLVRTYSNALAEFRDQAIEYRPLRAAAGESEVTVRSLLRRSGAEPLTIDYDMADGAAGWRIYDVKIAGVSVVLAYRESFAATVRESGIDGLIRALEDKNRQNRSRAAGA